MIQGSLIFSLNSNLTNNLNELKESCQQQSEELQDLLIQRDKLQEEAVMNGDQEDTLINDRDLEKPAAAATPSKVRDAKKKAKKEVDDLSFEDEVLQVEDLEPPGVAATKVCVIPRGISMCNTQEYFHVQYPGIFPCVLPRGISRLTPSCCLFYLERGEIG